MLSGNLNLMSGAKNQISKPSSFSNQLGTYKQIYRYTHIYTALCLNRYEPFGLGHFATDRCYAPQVNGHYAALLLTNFYFS